MHIDNLNLKQKAKELRRSVLDLGLKTGEGHLGGSFSEIEILVSLYEKILTSKDKFILSKGHACYPLYILLRDKGFNPKIAGHPDLDPTNGIYATTGSLGHGLPIALGMAMAKKIKNQGGRIYVLMGDGECQEGTTWESSLIATHHKLDNLTAIVDYNGLQALDKTENIQSLKNLDNIFNAIGWNVSEVDGHNFEELINAFQTKSYEKPKMIIAHTIKGKGVSYMENNPEWHGKRITAERVAKAFEELK